MGLRPLLGRQRLAGARAGDSAHTRGPGWRTCCSAAGCPTCGGTDLDLIGLVYGKTTAYPKLHCQGCGAYVKVLRNGDTRPA